MRKIWHEIERLIVVFHKYCVVLTFPASLNSLQMSCPLQLACKSLLSRGRGRQLVRYLVSHGANLDYVDHALRDRI